MQFDMENLNPGVWFEWEGDAKVQLRVCDTEKMSEIRKSTVKVVKEVVFHPTTRVAQKVEDEKVDEENYSKLLWDYCIVDWKNISDASGNPIPCTTENKMKLMTKSFKFSKFIGDSISKLIEKEAQESETRLKN